MLGIVGLVVLLSTMNSIPDWSRLAETWSKELSIAHGVKHVARTLPLLDEPTSVPFVCRYRPDAIGSLTPVQVHQLSRKYQKYKSLANLRSRLLEKVPKSQSQTRRRVETSTSKTELEAIYEPFKPPAKGTLEERYRKEHPALSEQIQKLWDDPSFRARSWKPWKGAVTLLGSKIAHQTFVRDVLLETTMRTCRIETKFAKEISTKDKSDYQAYHSFKGLLHHLQDHQVLAIRRGVGRKVLILKFDLDGDRMEARIRNELKSHQSIRYNTHSDLWGEAIHDAWARLLRRQCTNRAWKEKCKAAEQRAIVVFCENVSRALLAPPFGGPPTPILAMDPGYKAGIKCALISPNGQLLLDDKKDSLFTVKFLGSQERPGAKAKLCKTLELLRSYTPKGKVVVAVGNGHGSHESRILVQEAAASIPLEIEVHLVNEAGASVWSVTTSAQNEFPSQPAAAIAAVSIGRRFVNPLHELVKIPPRSLGLGMYQHDLSEKELEEQLHATCVDAVAAVGVEVNSCSLELLQKVPGLTKTLSQRIIDARPLSSRSELLQIRGIGAKAFENCAGFIRIKGVEKLDNTLVHPESYNMARWLLQKQGITLSSMSSIRKLKDEDTTTLTKAGAKKFGVPEGRVESVWRQLMDSMTNADPRIKMGGSQLQKNAIGSTDGCTELPPDLLQSPSKLAKACPVRKIRATVCNVVDFGVFVDVGLENNALVHTSKIGGVDHRSLLIGSAVGVDILEVRQGGKVSAALTGLDSVSAANPRQNKQRPAKVATIPQKPKKRRGGSEFSNKQRKRRKL